MRSRGGGSTGLVSAGGLYVQVGAAARQRDADAALVGGSRARRRAETRAESQAGGDVQPRDGGLSHARNGRLHAADGVQGLSGLARLLCRLEAWERPGLGE